MSAEMPFLTTRQKWLRSALQLLPMPLSAALQTMALAEHRRAAHELSRAAGLCFAQPCSCANAIVCGSGRADCRAQWPLTGPRLTSLPRAAPWTHCWVRDSRAAHRSHVCACALHGGQRLAHPALSRGAMRSCPVAATAVPSTADSPHRQPRALTLGSVRSVPLAGDCTLRFRAGGAGAAAAGCRRRRRGSACASEARPRC